MRRQAHHPPDRPAGARTCRAAGGSCGRWCPGTRRLCSSWLASTSRCTRSCRQVGMWAGCPVGSGKRQRAAAVALAGRLCRAAHTLACPSGRCMATPGRGGSWLHSIPAFSLPAPCRLRPTSDVCSLLTSRRRPRSCTRAARCCRWASTRRFGCRLNQKAAPFMPTLAPLSPTLLRPPTPNPNPNPTPIPPSKLAGPAVRRDARPCGIRLPAGRWIHG